MCAVELVGSFQGSGRTDDTYLARRGDGQWVQLSPLLWLTLSNLDGIRSSAQVADRVTADWGRPIAGEDIDYLIDKKLLPVGLVGTTSDKEERPDLVLALRFKKVLVPARVVSAIARPLRFLFWGPLVLLVAGLFLAVETYALASGHLLAAVRQTLSQPSDLLLVVGLIVLSIPVHEFGHASGSRYGGARPGDMGIGIYVTAPAFFTDLSDAYRLGRAGRVRGDLGGVYFNAVYAVAVFSFYLITGSALLLLVIAAMILEIIEQMMPFVRSDGYWAISDLAGVPDLFSYVGAVFRRGQAAGSQFARLTPSVAPARHGLEPGHRDRVANRNAVLPSRSARIGSGGMELHPAPRSRSVRPRGDGHGRGHPRDRFHMRHHDRHDLWGLLHQPGGSWVSPPPTHLLELIQPRELCEFTESPERRWFLSLSPFRWSGPPLTFAFTDQRKNTQQMEGTMKGFVAKTALAAAVVVGPVVGMSAGTATPRPCGAGRTWWPTRGGAPTPTGPTSRSHRPSARATWSTRSMPSPRAAAGAVTPWRSTPRWTWCPTPAPRPNEYDVATVVDKGSGNDQNLAAAAMFVVTSPGRVSLSGSGWAQLGSIEWQLRSLTLKGTTVAAVQGTITSLLGQVVSILESDVTTTPHAADQHRRGGAHDCGHPGRGACRRTGRHQRSDGHQQHPVQQLRSRTP